MSVFYSTENHLYLYSVPKYKIDIQYKKTILKSELGIENCPTKLFTKCFQLQKSSFTKLRNTSADSASILHQMGTAHKFFEPIEHKNLQGAKSGGEGFQHCSGLFFRQKILQNEMRCELTVIVVKNPTVRYPQPQPLFPNYFVQLL